jgi:hypothetical protein
MKRLEMLSAVLALSGCVQAVSVSRNIQAPSRPANCELELVQADMMELSPMGTRWDYLGTVSIAGNHDVDPTSEAARAMIRAKACELGGTSVALMVSSNGSAPIGSSAALMYAVLRPKQGPAAPTKF